MNSVSADKIRNVALVGHGGVGKTSLAEALLHRAGVISRQGRVEDGNTVCDYDATEHERGLSLSLSLAPFEWNGFKINLIDTPGYADFVGDVWSALQVADLAVFVVSAVEGVEVQHEVVWLDDALVLRRRVALAIEVEVADRVVQPLAPRDALDHRVADDQ